MLILAVNNLAVNSLAVDDALPLYVESKSVLYTQYIVSKVSCTLYEASYTLSVLSEVELDDRARVVHHDRRLQSDLRHHHGRADPAERRQRHDAVPAPSRRALALAVGAITFSVAVCFSS